MSIHISWDTLFSDTRGIYHALWDASSLNDPRVWIPCIMRKHRVSTEHLGFSSVHITEYPTQLLPLKVLQHIVRHHSTFRTRCYFSRLRVTVIPFSFYQNFFSLYSVFVRNVRLRNFILLCFCMYCVYDFSNLHTVYQAFTAAGLIIILQFSNL